jgi:shikimate dehydrogenase
MKITAQTRIAGVVGNPVRHSLSPVIHNAWIQAAGLDAVYLAFEPPKNRFEPFVDGLRGGTVLGLNVTIPFKEEALDLADNARLFAKDAGAANILLFQPDGSIVADNTDGAGLLGALAFAGAELKGGRIVVLGAGGAARGAVDTLAASGAAEVRVVNRTVERAHAIARRGPRVSAHAWSDLAEVLEDADAIVNATSLGMTGQPRLDVPLECAPKDAVVVDMVYAPLETDLLKQAAERGHRIADGLEMLIAQAAPSFASFFGIEPPEIDVRRLCKAALSQHR